MNIEALEKMASKSEKKAAVDWSSIKGNVNWEAIKQKIDQAKKWYEGQGAGTRALIGAGAGLGTGALLGKLMGRTGTGAVAGALAGAGAGAYWKDVIKAIDAAKPVAADATKKTKDRVSQFIQKMLPKTTQGEKAPSGEEDALAKARRTAPTADNGSQFLADVEKTKANGGLQKAQTPKGVNLVVR